MISIVPGLEFVQSIRGLYRADEEGVEVEIWKCGYGVAMEMRDGPKTRFVGVFAAYGHDLECHGLMGFPFTVHLEQVGVSDSSVELSSETLELSLALTARDDGIDVRIGVTGREQELHLVRQA